MRVRNLVFFVFVAAISCGRPQAPEVEIVTYPGGAKTKLSDFRGKPVLIDMWATWCGPCRESMPDIQRLYNQFGEKGLQIAAITTETPAAVKEFLQSNPYSYPIFLDPQGSANRAFNVEGIPVSIVLDKDGGVVWRGHPGEVEQLERAVKATLD